MLALAACGGNSQDEDEIIAAIKFAATSGDPEVCTEAQTANFNQQIGGDPSQDAAAATKQCERDAAEAPADEIAVSNVEVNGNAATATGAVTGSILDGQTLNLALVKEGDQWKLDELSGFEAFDRDAFDAGLIQEFAGGGSDGPTSKQADCVAANFEKLTDQEVQGFFLGTTPELGNRLFGPCFGGQ